MEDLLIRYTNGWMKIHLGEFFPCNQDRAKKLFRLVKGNCSGDEREELGTHLYRLREYYRARVETYGQDRGNVPADWSPGGSDEDTQRERKTKYRKARLNYLLFCEMEVDDAWMN